jgi:hypothetical protein
MSIRGDSKKEGGTKSHYIYTVVSSVRGGVRRSGGFWPTTRLGGGDGGDWGREAGVRLQVSIFGLRNR